MQGPFRYQAAAGDCFPTSMMNAVAALYPFYDVPSLVIQRIYEYALDDDAAGSGGTTDEAGRFLAAWLARFRRKGFAVSTEFLQGPEVRLREGGKILRHLRIGGVAVLDTYSAAGTRHSILALRAGRDWIDCWDPRYRVRATIAPDMQRLRPATPEEPNLRVRKSRFEKTGRKACMLGPLADRCAILLSRR